MESDIGTVPDGKPTGGPDVRYFWAAMHGVYSASSLARSWREGRISADDQLEKDGRRLTFSEACGENPWLLGETGLFPNPTKWHNQPLSGGHPKSNVLLVLSICMLLVFLVASVWLFWMRAGDLEKALQKSKSENRALKAEYATKETMLHTEINCLRKEVSAAMQDLQESRSTNLALQASFQEKETVFSVARNRLANELQRQVEALRESELEIQRLKAMQTEKENEFEEAGSRLKQEVETTRKLLREAESASLAFQTRLDEKEKAYDVECKRLNSEVELVKKLLHDMELEKKDVERKFVEKDQEANVAQTSLKKAMAENQAMEDSHVEEIKRLEADLKILRAKVESSESKLLVKINVVVDGLLLKGEKVRIGGREWSTPIVWSVKEKEKYGGNTVSYERDGRRYVGKLQRFIVNWRGTETFSVTLERCDANEDASNVLRGAEVSQLPL